MKRTALKKVEAKRELLRTKRRMSQMMQLPSLDALTNSESFPRTCVCAHTRPAQAPTPAARPPSRAGSRHHPPAAPRPGPVRSRSPHASARTPQPPPFSRPRLGKHRAGTAQISRPRLGLHPGPAPWACTAAQRLLRRRPFAFQARGGGGYSAPAAEGPRRNAAEAGSRDLRRGARPGPAWPGLAQPGRPGPAWPGR